MPFQIIRSDITKTAADAIVNTANPFPTIGAGTDSAIYQAAGKDLLLAERRKIGPISAGEAVYTPAFDLNAKYIIHTVGPVWIDGNHKEREILHSCYAKSLNLAADLHCESIAFPLISSGTYGFPKDEALQIALAEIGKFLLTHDMNVTLVVFDRKAVQISKELMGDIDEYIDDHTVGYLRKKEYGNRSSWIDSRRRRARDFRPDMDDSMVLMDRIEPEDIILSKESIPDTAYAPMPPASKPSTSAIGSSLFGHPGLEGYLKKKGETFQERLFKLIDERHMSDPEVYKKANIDRKVFSKIRCNPNYHPKKKTAVAFAIALELDMPAAQDLLARAGLAISPSSDFDLIISYFIDKKIYDIFQINAALFHYGQELLGF